MRNRCYHCGSSSHVSSNCPEYRKHVRELRQLPYLVKAVPRKKKPDYEITKLGGAIILLASLGFLIVATAKPE